MTNRRSYLFFLAGILILSALVCLLECRRCAEAADEVRTTLGSLPVGEVAALELRKGDTLVAALVRTNADEWVVQRPFRARAADAPVARLLDVALLQPVADWRTAHELDALRMDWAHFGLAPAWSTLTLTTSRGRSERIFFGRRSASGREVYAAVEGQTGVFMLSADALSAIPATVDGFRSRAVLPFAREDVAGLDFRVPNVAFVKLVRQETGWRLTSPADAPAETAHVDALVDFLTAARVVDFVLPSAARLPTPGSANAISRDTLAMYGLADESGLAVTVRVADGGRDQIVFGGPAGTNRVYALVRGGEAVVTVDAALADRCRVGEATFRDTRVFPNVDMARLKNISLTLGPMVYVLAQGSNGVWRLESPVAAPADPAVAAAVVETALHLKQNDVLDAASADSDDSVRVTVSTEGTPPTGVTVPRRVFGLGGAFADLRSKTMFELDPTSVRRLTLTSVAGTTNRETIVVRDAEKGTWRLARRTGATETRMLDVDAVGRLLAAIVRVEAVGVETVSSTPDDTARCGLLNPAFTLTVDVESADAVRRNILLGGAAPGGGRYATVGGLDAIFILSRKTVADLTAPILR